MNFQEVNLKDLGDLAAQLNTANAKVDLLEAQLADAKKDRDKLSMETIPAIMQNAGLAELKIPSGETLTVLEDVKVSIPKDPGKRHAAFEFLREQGFGDSIKREARIPEPDQKTIMSLKEWGVSFEESEDIHWSTLASAFRDVLGMKKGSIQRVAPNEIPEVFNLFMYKKTKIK
jgi:hypothetical protein